MLALSCLQASAQRTMNRQPSIRLDALVTDSSFGADAFYSQYTLGGFWESGIRTGLYSTATSAGPSLDCLHFAVEGRYMFRLVGTRSRSVSLYGGAGAFIGYESIDPFAKFPSIYESKLKNGYFLYGLTTSLEAEFFVSRTVALTLTGNIPINFSSPLGMFHYEGGLGVKILL